MEQISSSSIYARIPPLSAKYPWLVAQNIEDDQERITRDLFFCTINNELPHYQCRIPRLLGQRIRGCSHGWMILSNHNNDKWSLCNPRISKILTLPTLILKDGGYEFIGECCLSAPPNIRSSILLLTKTNKAAFVFCRLNHKRKKFIRWTEMSYAYQLKRVTGDGKLVSSLACCNRKVYALSTDGTFAQFVLHIDILVKDKEVVIKLELFGACPSPSVWGGEILQGDIVQQYLKGSATNLYYIKIFMKEEQKIPIDVHLYRSDLTRIDWDEREILKYWDLCDYATHGEVTKENVEDLDMSVETWKHMGDLKGGIFFVNLGHDDQSISYRCGMGSELGGFIHMRDENGATIYSYHVKKNTITVFPIPTPILPSSDMSLWQCSLKDDLGEAECKETENNSEIVLRSGIDDVVKYNESHLLNAPLNILETIMEFCTRVEFMKFRATCKQCHLAGPSVNWSNDTSIRKLQMSSVVSPWLMVVDRKRGVGVVTFTDPMLGDNYFMKRSHISIVNRTFCGSRFGWLLFESQDLNCLVFFNPFTNDIRELPDAECYFESLCFSAPPTSLDCMVVGFTKEGVDILFVNQEQTWRTQRLGPDPYSISFPTFIGRDLYTLGKEGQLIVINNLEKEECSWKIVETEAPKGSCTSSPQYFLTNCNEDLLLVIVGEYGGPVEVYKRNESKQEWDIIDCVGKHTIYISGTTCLCIEAKVPRMENKVFFARLHSKNGKVVFYSLDTCKYHTFDGENLQVNEGDLLGTTYHLSHNAWIEPSWS